MVPADVFKKYSIKLALGRKRVDNVGNFYYLYYIHPKVICLEEI